MSRAARAGDDTAKALEIFKQPDAKIDRSVFLTVTARALFEQADLFSPKKLDRPDRIAMLLKEAEEALSSVPDNKETKDLMAKIAKLRKTLKTT